MQLQFPCSSQSCNLRELFSSVRVVKVSCSRRTKVFCTIYDLPKFFACHVGASVHDRDIQIDDTSLSLQGVKYVRGRQDLTENHLDKLMIISYSIPLSHRVITNDPAANFFSRMKSYTDYLLQLQFCDCVKIKNL